MLCRWTCLACLDIFFQYFVGIKLNPLDQKFLAGAKGIGNLQAISSTMGRVSHRSKTANIGTFAYICPRKQATRKEKK
jgi:hypothetical protein